MNGDQGSGGNSRVVGKKSTLEKKPDAYSPLGVCRKSPHTAGTGEGLAYLLGEVTKERRQDFVSKSLANCL